MITKERARNIIDQAKALSMYGPWVDQIDKIITSDEKKEIIKHWESLKGETSFVDALFDFLHGRVENKSMNKDQLREGSPIKVRTNNNTSFEHFNVKGVFDGRAYHKDNEPGIIVTVFSSPVRTFPIEDCILCNKEDDCKATHELINQSALVD